MKIIHVIDSLKVGGAERVVVEISNMFEEKGHNVSLLVIKNDLELGCYLNPGVKLISLDRKYKYNPIKLVRLFLILKQYEIIHVHLHYNLLYVFFSGIFLFKGKIFYHEHNGNTKLEKSYLRLPAWALEKCVIFCVTNTMKLWLKQVQRIEKLNLYLLPNITRKYENNQPKASCYKMVMISNIGVNKNIKFAIELLGQLGNEFTLTVFGKIIDREYYNELIFLINDLKLNQRVTFISNVNNVQPLLKNFGLGIHTSISESGPLSLIEFMAQDLPFITYNTGEVVQQVKNRFPQFIMNEFDIELWRNQIDIINNTNNLSDLISVFFDEYYSEESYYNECYRIYKKA
jgi:glycosyltransferase involved in cell wall biosynthesis